MLTLKAQRFLLSNMKSPVVSGSVRKNVGVYYRLKNGERFVLTFNEVRELPMPVWDI